MMAWSVGDVDQAVATASAKIAEARGYTSAASEVIGEGRHALAAALGGAADGEAVDALTAHDAVGRQLAEVGELLRAVVARIETYRAQLGVAQASPAAPRGGTVNAAVPRPGPHPNSALPRPPRPGKTHGRWVTRDGDTVMLESGRGGEYYRAARTRAVELGLTYGRPNAEAAVARHVEIQFAARMRALGIRHAEIEVNRRVCGTRAGRDDDLSDTCDKQLPRFLPPGATLRVRDGSSPEGRVYEGSLYEGRDDNG